MATVILSNKAKLSIFDELLQVCPEGAGSERVKCLRDVVVDAGQQCSEGRTSVRLEQGLAHFVFPSQAVLDQALGFGMRMIYQVAMSGRQRVDLEREQSPQRLQVSPHIPIRRLDDDGRALHDVITGEQHAGFGQQEAQMVGGVAGRVYRTH